MQTDSTGAAAGFPVTLTSSFAAGAPKDMTLVAEGQTSHTVMTATFHAVAP